MKKPIKASYCKPFKLDAKLVSFDSKAYARDAAAYIEHLEQIMKLTAANLRDMAVRSREAGDLLHLANRLDK